MKQHGMEWDEEAPDDDRSLSAGVKGARGMKRTRREENMVFQTIPMNRVGARSAKRLKPLEEMDLEQGWRFLNSNPV